MSAEGDVDLVVRAEFFPCKTNGVLLEVGAAKPNYLSIGASFREVGWRVISVEPNPEFADMHRALGHEIYEYACAEEDRDHVDFVVAKGKDLEYGGGRIGYELFSSLGIRGKYQELLDKLHDRFTLETIRVKTRRLDTILSLVCGVNQLDVLSIDVEGWEMECLRGFSFGALAPKVAIVENLFRDADLPHLMEAFGYTLWRHIEPNDVYVITTSTETMMVSYTPNFEDVLLQRCFRDVRNGFYVDVGAHHPTNASVTRWFYDQGWSGINIEPGEGIEALRAERPRDINLAAAVADFDGETTFWVHAANPGTSSLSESVPPAVAERAGEIRPITVTVTTLQSVLDRYAHDRHIHFLKIDAEGAEDAIVRSTDWARFRPEVIVIESTEPYTNNRRQENWQDLLKSSKYEFAYFDGVNDFWVRKESNHLLRAFSLPVNVLDFFRCYDPEVISLRNQVSGLITELATATARVTALEAAAAKGNIDCEAAEANDQHRALDRPVRRIFQRIFGRASRRT